MSTIPSVVPPLPFEFQAAGGTFFWSKTMNLEGGVYLFNRPADETAYSRDLIQMIGAHQALVTVLGVTVNYSDCNFITLHTMNSMCFKMPKQFTNLSQSFVHEWEFSAKKFLNQLTDTSAPATLGTIEKVWIQTAIGWLGTPDGMALLRTVLERHGLTVTGAPQPAPA